MFRGGLPIPLGTLVTVTTIEANKFNDQQSAIFAAESCVLAYELWFGEGGAHRAKFGRLAELLNRGESAGAAFAEAFPEGTGALEARVAALAQKGTLPTVALAHTAAELAQAVTVEPAPEAELQAARVLVYAGTAASGKAEAALTRLQQLEPEAATTLEAEAEFFLATNDQTATIEVMRRAAAAGSKNYAMYLLPAVMVSSEMYLTEYATDRTNARLARIAVDDVKRAIALRPTAENYEIFPMLIGAVDAVNDDDGRVVSEARRRWPHSGLFVAGEMAYALHKGDLAQASAALKLLVEGKVGATERTALFANKLRARFGAMSELAELESRLAAGDHGQVKDLVQSLRGAPLTAKESLRVAEAAAAAQAIEAMERLRRAVAEKDWGTAGNVLDELKERELSAAARTEVTQLAQKVAEGKTVP